LADFEVQASEAKVGEVSDVDTDDETVASDHEDPTPS
jgi:hypothetical protein